VAKLEVTLTIGSNKFDVDLSHPIDISIPVNFGAPQLLVFHAPHATSEPYTDAGFVGSVARGGSCNCEIHTLIPHTSGTHTECVGHISNSRLSIYDTLKASLFAATLVTVTPQKQQAGSEEYPYLLEPSDLLLTLDSLKHAVNQAQTGFLQAVIIRTLPNSADKITRNYDETRAPFFSTAAMKFLVERNIRHLLVDIPSVDRLNDGGRLTNHRIFWNVPEGSTHVERQTASTKTITELIYVPDTVADGPYLLNLQPAPFIADAAPSRPTLYKVRAI
jgi:kynurenine formamidase